MKTQPLFSPWDIDVAHENFNAMCGHGSLAAALGTDVCRVMQYFAGGGWVNIPMMRDATRRAGWHTWRATTWATAMSVTMLQWRGPWMNPGVPVAARCQYRHWVAACDGLVWDVNEPRWMPRDEWAAKVVPLLIPKRGDGSYEVVVTLFGLTQPLRTPASASTGPDETS